ncbi:hypothetical protein RJJ65_32260 [Rhizobium hidalgonense]|uniref:Uncharacterized protein n=1 Tax=Rhizobium hidalgonense TaxID=1538159 RepID=A0AAJ2H1X2_9HYPH|nr:hypothetical protein [Rhizobium hidalgonense]MDR9777233.1 hypothetical protein [Rhizobium hidalgonense]
MIYFAQPTNGGPIRIGASEGMNARRRTLGTWLPGGVEVILEITGSFLGEAVLHHCFNPIRIERDWFRSCDVIWRFVLDAKTKRQQWIPVDKGPAIRIDRSEFISEFGDIDTAASVLGYKSVLQFETALKWQTGAGYSLSSKMAFIKLLKAGRLPKYISDLHKDFLPVSAGVEVAA